MTDREALLAEIREHPEEDTPRLAFADLLDERGDAYFSDWAALIRSQVESARIDRYSPRWMELIGRQGELCRKRKRDWDLSWGSRLGVAAYRRGFKECDSLDLGGKSVAEVDKFFTRYPLRCVRLSPSLPATSANSARAEKFIRAVIGHPAAARVESLDVEGNRRTTVRELLPELAAAMPRLRVLGLGGLRLTAASAVDLLISANVRGLTALGLDSNDLFERDAGTGSRPESLFHSPALAGLRRLDLHDTHPHRDALLALANSPVIRELRHLDLSLSWHATPNTQFGPDGAEALAGGPALRGLEVLNLGSQGIGSRGLSAFVRSGLLATVRELDLSGNQIDDEGFIDLANSPHAASLRKLDINGNRLGDAGAAALLASPHLADLRILKLDHGYTSDVTAASDPLRERFPDREPVLENLGTTFFEPIP